MHHQEESMKAKWSSLRVAKPDSCRLVKDVYERVMRTPHSDKRVIALSASHDWKDQMCKVGRFRVIEWKSVRRWMWPRFGKLFGYLKRIFFSWPRGITWSRSLSQIENKCYPRIDEGRTFDAMNGTPVRLNRVFFCKLKKIIWWGNSFLSFK